jgi:branched-chain amino acid transport system ATP-binding protein
VEPVVAVSFLKVESLSISFGGIQALSGISFEVEQGEIFAIIGPNGAGKTTLFNCINGIYRADEGRIIFKDREMQGKKPHAVARMGIGRTFQNIELFNHMNTMENMMLGRHIHMKGGLFRGIFMWGSTSFAGEEEIAHRAKVEEVIDLLDLQSVRDKPVGGLPYGTQKRVELGRALALEPELLLMDEPSAGMNLEEKQDMIFWIEDIRAELKVTMLLIEHDMKVVMDISDRILAINFGRSIVEGSPRAVQKDPEVLKAYLGEDETIGRVA